MKKGKKRDKYKNDRSQTKAVQVVEDLRHSNVVQYVGR